MNLLDDIPEAALVALDTMIWIYEFEAHPVFGPVVHPFIRDRLAMGLNHAGSSLLTLAVGNDLHRIPLDGHAGGR